MRHTDNKVAFALANVALALLEASLASDAVAVIATGIAVPGHGYAALGPVFLVALAITFAAHVRYVSAHTRRKAPMPLVAEHLTGEHDQAADACNGRSLAIEYNDRATSSSSPAGKRPGSNTGETIETDTCATTRAIIEPDSDLAADMNTPADENARTITNTPTPVTPARLMTSVSTSRPTSQLDVGALFERITSTSDPLAELKLFVGDIRRCEAADVGLEPSPFERFAARMLEEAGLFATDVELPDLRIIRPPASGMLYLRVSERSMPYLAKVRILSVEAALNAVRLVDTYFDNPDQHEMEEHYQLLQRITRSICLQSPNLNENVPVIEDEHPDTEWAVRLGISTAIESLQLPHRLVANWRVNVADGNVAIELELTPDAVFPRTMYVDDLGLVASSREMRHKAASAYALRLALLVCAYAFRCSTKVRHVWVAGIMETARRRDCYLSVDFDRWRFSQLDLANLGRLDEVYHLFAPQLRYEDAILRPVRQTFSLGEFRFCPPRRYESIDLSSRALPSDAVASLGTTYVSGLAINEGDKRELVATSIMRRLTDSTADNVHTILELAADDPDPSVRSAAERTVQKLIAGTIDDNPFAVREEFTSGDALSQAVAAAQRAFVANDAAMAASILEGVLGPIDAADTYVDSPTVEWRYFPSYVNRTMYNRLCATQGHTLLLVPDAYYEAHLLLSAALLALGRPDEAVSHAQRLVELSPLDARARLHAVRCLEAQGKPDEAISMLADLLACAHDPQSLGLGYYRMAFFQWRQGNLLAAQACYQRAMGFMPGAMPVIAMELTALALQNPGSIHDELTGDEGETVLQQAGIPVAPTEAISSTFLEAARASLDAELFPVARNFAAILGSFSNDDILMGVIRSIEDEPDV